MIPWTLCARKLATNIIDRLRQSCLYANPISVITVSYKPELDKDIKSLLVDLSAVYNVRVFLFLFLFFVLFVLIFLCIKSYYRCAQFVPCLSVYILLLLFVYLLCFYSLLSFLLRKIKIAQTLAVASPY